MEAKEALRLEADFVAVLETIANMSPETMCDMFGFLHGTTKNVGETRKLSDDEMLGNGVEPHGEKAAARVHQEEDALAQRGQPNAEEMYQQAVAMSHMFCDTFNSTEIGDVICQLKLRLTPDCSYMLPLSRKVLRGLNCTLLIVCMLYYAYPDCLLSIEDDSLVLLTPLECQEFKSVGPEDMVAAARFTLNFSGTLVSRRPVHDVVSNVTDKSLREKLSSLLSSTASSSSNAAPPCPTPNPATTNTTTNASNPVTSSALLSQTLPVQEYAELFLLAAETALKGEAFAATDAAGGTISISQTVTVGYNSDGKVVFWQGAIAM